MPRVELKYTVTRGKNEEVEHGLMSSGNFDIIKIAFLKFKNVADVEKDYKCINGDTHFLKCYSIIPEENKMIVEDFDDSLNKWLEENSNGVTLMNANSCDHQYILVNEGHLDIIRSLVMRLVKLHDQNMCFQTNFTSKDVVFVEGLPKFKATKLWIKRHLVTIDILRPIKNNWTS